MAALTAYNFSMWRWLAIFGVLVAPVWVAVAGQSSPPSTPKQGVAKQSSSSGTQVPAQCDGEKDAPCVTVIVNNQLPAPVTDPNKAKDDEDIRIQRKIANFTAWLVGVGALQALALIGTLIVVNRQVALMREHAESLKTLGDAAKDNTDSAHKTLAALKEQNDNLLISAKAATVTATASNESAKAALGQIEIMKSRERAKLVIRQLEIPELFPPGSSMNGDRALKVRVIVENLGGSRAFNVRAWGMMNIVSDRMGDNYDVGIPQIFPSIIDADQQKHFLNVAGLGREFEGVATTGDYTAIPEELAQRIRNGEVFIVASGALVYEDIFDDTYETPFNFVWHSFGNDDGRMWMTESYWLDRSPRSRRVYPGKTPEDNGQNPN